MTAARSTCSAARRRGATLDVVFVYGGPTAIVPDVLTRLEAAVSGIGC